MIQRKEIANRKQLTRIIRIAHLHQIKPLICVLDSEGFEFSDSDRQSVANRIFNLPMERCAHLFDDLSHPKVLHISQDVISLAIGSTLPSWIRTMQRSVVRKLVSKESLENLVKCHGISALSRNHMVACVFMENVESMLYLHEIRSDLIDSRSVRLAVNQGSLSCLKMIASVAPDRVGDREWARTLWKSTELLKLILQTR